MVTLHHTNKSPHCTNKLSIIALQSTHLNICRGVKAHPVQFDLRLVGSQIEDWQIIVLHNALALRKGVADAHLFEICAGNFAEVMGDDDAKLSIALHLVVIHLHRFVDIAERHVNFDKKYVALIVRVGVEHSNQTKLFAPKIQILVDCRVIYL